MTGSHGVKTLLMVIPYGIGWKAILNEKTVNYLTSRDIRLVMVAESQDIGITHPMVSNEGLVPYNRSKFEIALGLLRNYVFADTSRKHSETLQLKMKVYERQTRAVRIMRILFGKRLSRVSVVKSFLAWLDLNLFRDKVYGKLFEKYRPDAVFIVYPFSFHIYPILRRAARQKIPTIAYVPSWDNLTSKWEVPAKFDGLIVWNKIMKDEAVELLDYDEKNVKICGIPQFDLYADPSIIIPRKEFLRTIGADPDRKLITYATGGEALYKEEAEIVEVIYEAMMASKFSKPCQLLIRLHPRRYIKDFARFEGKQDVIIQTPGEGSEAFEKSGYFWVSNIMDSITLANTLAHTDVLINIASTITLEACILNKPVVNVGFDGRSQREYYSSVRRYFDYTHYRNMLKTGGVRVAFTKEELVRIVNTYLEDNTIDADGRKRIVESQCYRMDGKALERILEFIVNFVNERKPLIAD